MNDQPRHRRGDALPRSLQPIGLSREVAAAFIDVSPSKFDEMVRDGRMPKPKKIDARRVWSRVEIEEAFAALPTDGEVQEKDEWDWDFVTSTPEERARTQLNPWERRLLFSLYRAGGCADPSTVEGGGPASRESLARRGLLLDDGRTLQLTEEGSNLAKSKGATVHKNAPLKQTPKGPRAPKAPPPSANPSLDSDLIPYRFTVGYSDNKLKSKLGLLEMKVLRQLHPLDGESNNRYDILGAGESTCGLLYARGFIEELGKRHNTWLAITEAGKRAYLAQR